MRGKLQEALDNVHMTYAQLVEIANDLVKPCVEDCDKLIEQAMSHIETMHNDAIRDLMLNLSLKAYAFSEIKEKSALTAECAEILRKEAYAKEYTLQEGTAAVKDSNASLNIGDEVLAEAVYNLAAAMFKTKLDEIHRTIDVLKTILMSRLSEAKLNNFTDAQTNN